MELHRGGSVQVGAWFEIGVELGQGAVDRGLTFESPLESRGALRPVADAEKGDAHVGEFSDFAQTVRRDPDHGVVPRAARELAEPHGGTRPTPKQATRLSENFPTVRKPCAAPPTMA